MSFSGTPLGQGRRLDHTSFLKKPSSTCPPSPNRLVPPRTSAQRLNPESWSVKDTSVNIASAFTLAADMPLAVPRSTSVEYERDANASLSKRLAPPPSRLNARTKPPSKTASLRHVPDSEEDEPHPENGRGKSPFQDIVSSAKRVYGTTSFYLQQKITNLAESSSDTLAHHSQQDPSYDYSREEEAYRSKNPAQRRNTTSAHKRNRISEDNKAYMPTLSDHDLSDEDDNDRSKGRRRRRKSRKDSSTGGPLTTLPVIQGDKRRHRRAKTTKAHEEEEDDASGSDGELTAERQSNIPLSVTRDSVPPSIRQPSAPPSIRQPSHPPSTRHPSLPPRQASLPPRDPSLPHEHDDEDGDDDNDDEPDSSADIEQGLDSIPEIDEEQLNELTSTSTSTIGRPLGQFVNFAARTLKATAISVAQILTTLLYFFGKILGTIFDVLRRPALWVSAAAGGSLSNALPNLAVFGLLLSAVYLYRVPLARHLSLPSHDGRPTFSAPDTPAANMVELSARLHKLESVLSEMSVDAQKGRQKAETGVREQAELVGRLTALESRVLAEYNRQIEVERERERATSEVRGVKGEVEALVERMRQQEKEKEREAPVSRGEGVAVDEETRSWVRVLEERVGSVEGGVKEALDLGRKANPGTSWWTKPGTGNKLGGAGLTIKSSDGQDMTAVISQLVDSAVSTLSKDTLAKPDFALHSGGARVIPSLTSPTFEMRPTTWRGSAVALLTGNGYAIGRPPITALHHETHNGHCWPFAGSEGQLGVALAAPVYVDEVSVDHVANEVAFDMRSAPRECEVWAMVEGEENVRRVEEWLDERAKSRRAATAAGEGQAELEEPAYPPTLPLSPQYVRLANFTYDIHAARSVQTFPVDPEVRALGVDFGIVVLFVKSNWGRDEFTCLYRLRVHGQRMSEMPMPNPNPPELGG